VDTEANLAALAARSIGVDAESGSQNYALHAHAVQSGRRSCRVGDFLSEDREEARA